MILPSKHLSQERALLTVGARILQHLHHPQTVSAIWEKLSLPETQSSFILGYDEYVLALDLLYLVNAIELEDGRLTRKSYDTSYI